MSDTVISGAISGLDWDTLVEQLMAVERKPVTALENRQKTIEEKSNAWKDINTRLYNLQTKADALKTRTTFYSRAAESSDSAVVTATASSAVPVGTYTVEVVRLAKAHTVASATRTSTTEQLNLAGNVVINGKTVSIEATDTLASIRDKINSTDDIGVTASIVQVSATEYRLVLVSNETGAAGAITLTDDKNVLLSLGLLVDNGGTIEANTIQAAEDAEVKVNSLTITRSTNTITDAVSGLTLNLKKEGGTASISVSNDADKAVSAVKAFVDQYNSAMEFIASKMTYDAETKEAGVLLGDSTLTQLQASLRQKVTARIPGLPNDMNSAMAIGLTFGAYGSSNANRLVLDEEKLRKALTENLDAVAKIFGATPTNVALAASGATATAVDGLGGPNEASPSTVYGAANAINGDTYSDRWGTAGGGWMDATEGVYPDILEIDFGSEKTIDQVNLWTLNSTTMPSTTYGVRDYKIQYLDGTEWKDIETVTGNTSGLRIHQFDPVTTQKIRIEVSASNGANDYSRIVEVEAYQYNEGIGSSISRMLKSYTQTGGILPQKQQKLEDEKKRLQDQIDRFEDRLEKREETLRAQFEAMEAAISRMQSQASALTALLSQYGNDRSS